MFRVGEIRHTLPFYPLQLGGRDIAYYLDRTSLDLLKPALPGNLRRAVPHDTVLMILGLSIHISIMGGRVVQAANMSSYPGASKMCRNWLALLEDGTQVEINEWSLQNLTKRIEE